MTTFDRDWSRLINGYLFFASAITHMHGSLSSEFQFFLLYVVGGNKSAYV